MTADTKDIAARLARECFLMFVKDETGQNEVIYHNVTAREIEALVRRAMVEALKFACEQCHFGSTSVDIETTIYKRIKELS